MEFHASRRSVDVSSEKRVTEIDEKKRKRKERKKLSDMNALESAIRGVAIKWRDSRENRDLDGDFFAHSNIISNLNRTLATV